jgi:hypothetical protein
MLSKEEREEMLADAHDPRRREMFAKAAVVGAGAPCSFEEYIKFLMDIQKVFGAFEYSREISRAPHTIL